eukprot:GABV01001877.1.p1 GENE.GABV01001877.1~~GABV01001877.1.p1  ORF type:complete len:205 (+),score=64.57 GABV01001877.1:34-615(+)
MHAGMFNGVPAPTLQDMFSPLSAVMGGVDFALPAAVSSSSSSSSVPASSPMAAAGAAAVSWTDGMHDATMAAGPAAFPPVEDFFGLGVSGQDLPASSSSPVEASSSSELGSSPLGSPSHDLFGDGGPPAPAAPGAVGGNEGFLNDFSLIWNKIGSIWVLRLRLWLSLWVVGCRGGVKAQKHQQQPQQRRPVHL